MQSLDLITNNPINFESIPNENNANLSAARPEKKNNTAPFATHMAKSNDPVLDQVAAITANAAESSSETPVADLRVDANGFIDDLQSALELARQVNLNDLNIVLDCDDSDSDSDSDYSDDSFLVMPEDGLTDLASPQEEQLLPLLMHYVAIVPSDEQYNNSLSIGYAADENSLAHADSNSDSDDEDALSYGELEAEHSINKVQPLLAYSLPADSLILRPDNPFDDLARDLAVANLVKHADNQQTISASTGETSNFGFGLFNSFDYELDDANLNYDLSSESSSEDSQFPELSRESTLADLELPIDYAKFKLKTTQVADIPQEPSAIDWLELPQQVAAEVVTKAPSIKTLVNAAVITPANSVDLSAPNRFEVTNFNLDISVRDQSWTSALGELITKQVYSAKIQHATVQLNPSELGPINLELVIGRNNQATINFEVANQETKKLLEQNFTNLGSDLRDNYGLDINLQFSSNQQRTEEREKFAERVRYPTTKSFDEQAAINSVERKRSHNGQIDVKV